MNEDIQSQVDQAAESVEAKREELRRLVAEREDASHDRAAEVRLQELRDEEERLDRQIEAAQESLQFQKGATAERTESGTTVAPKRQAASSPPATAGDVNVTSEEN